MTATRVRGELGPACAKCGSLKVWTGVTRPVWSCRPCGAERTRRFKAAKSVERLEADRVRANALRNARNAEWTPEKRAAANAQTAAWRAANREKHRQASRDWYAAYGEAKRNRQASRYREDPSVFIARNMVRKKRLREAICEHGPACVDATFLSEVYSQPCFYCEAQTEDADHFYPISGGGLHCRENIVPACGPCNGSKFNHDPIEWMRSRVS